MVLKKAGSKPVPKKVMKKVEPPKPTGKRVKSIKKTEPAPPKKMIKSKPKPPPKPLTGPVPVIPKNFKWKGKVDPHNKNRGYLLVPLDKVPDSFPKHHDRMVPDTYFRIDPKHNESKGMVTITPKGLHISWSTCAVCMNLTTRCICRVGYIHPRSIEHMVIKSQWELDHQADKERVPPPPSTGKVDITHPEYSSRGLYWYMSKTYTDPASKAFDLNKRREAIAAKTVSTPRKVLRKAGGPSDPPWDTKPAERRSVPPKKVLRKAQPDPEPIDISMEALNGTAEDMAAALTKKISKQIKSNGTKKTLKKIKR